MKFETDGLGGQRNNKRRAPNHQSSDERDRMALEHRDGRSNKGHDTAVLHREGLYTRGSALSCEGLERLVQLGVDVNDAHKDHQQNANELR